AAARAEPAAAPATARPRRRRRPGPATAEEATGSRPGSAAPAGASASLQAVEAPQAAGAAARPRAAPRARTIGPALASARRTAAWDVAGPVRPDGGPSARGGGRAAFEAADAS